MRIIFKLALHLLPVQLLFASLLASAQSGGLRKVEYYIDNDPGYGNGTAISLTTGADSLANATVEITQATLAKLPSGLHTLYLRAQDTSAGWGQDVGWQFVKPGTAASTTTLSQMEYYIDTDPGYGKATQFTITPGVDSAVDSIINANVGLLANGQHVLFVRARNSNNTWGQDVGWQFKNSASTLPLTLLSFTGTMQHSGALLQWQTTDEINTQSFTIERSGNGASYTALGSVPATDAPALNNYSYTDTKPLEGDNYYRLKMYDKDGAFTYSRIVKLNNGGGAFSVQVYPNPTATSATIAFNSLTAGKYSVTVADMDGKTVKRIEGVAATGANGLQLDISGLATGVYMVTFNSADGTHTVKLVKK